MRDPWFPIVCLLIVVIACWLGIAGPLDGGFFVWLYKWQTLVAATVATTIASVAAYIAYHNTNRTLRHNEYLKRRERARKRAAIRAMLPLALAQIVTYAQRSGLVLNQLIAQCQGDVLPVGTTPQNLAEPLPSENLQLLAEFIEYADDLDVGLIETTVAWIQIHDSRVRTIVNNSHDPTKTSTVLRHNLEGSILDAAAIYAAAGAAFEYSRRRTNILPRTVSWNDVRNALGLMRVWDHENPRLYQLIDGREQRSAGPFDSLMP